MKNNFTLSAIAFSLGSVLALSGCGGSSDSSSAQANPSAATIMGTIEHINPSDRSLITVNGIDYQVGELSYRNEALDNAVLAEGMMVQVQKTAKTTTANVTLEPTMTGIVTKREGTHFAVNGIDLEFANLDSDIEVNDWVFVSSLPTANAGYQVLSVVEIDVEHTYPGLADVFELEGRIADIDPNTTTLTLGSHILVNYNNIPSAIQDKLRIGQWIEVEGAQEGNLFVAHELEIDGYDQDDAYDDSDIEGIITSVENATSTTPSFTLNFRGNFATNAATCFRLDDSNRCDKGLIAELKPGVEVEVTSRQVAGQRIASVVEFEQPDWDDGIWQGQEFECEGYADYDSLNQTFTITRCEDGFDRPMENTTVVIDAQTRFEGIAQENLHGALIEVEGIIIDKQNVAREIELED